MGTISNQAREIFLEAIELDSPVNRTDFLDRACEGNPELRTRVERLLRSNKQLGSFHDNPCPNGMSGEAPLTELPGTIIGPYKLLDQIGEGGFGVVFLAEQERPVRRRVALKVIKPGMDTRAVVARFEAERQALAMMDHPNIAKVFDAGATEAGRPYFVMELVQGVPITEYCDQCNLTTRERLELFVTVCQAVQHAHQKGVIHRDLKPTNVLVAIQDCKPTPKIIDFGVAKAIGEPLTEHTLTTAFAQMVGTPLYMSPEQAELSPLGIDTRSDIYSLGVMLYELLTGATPYDQDRLHEASYDELRRIIREEEPPRPTPRISTLAADLATTIAERRRTDTRHLRQTVGGDLDWIVMKCLEKDRNRRYETPNSLARDIERYLHDEPVQASPPSTAYRVRKYMRRNKRVLAFVALLVAAIVFQAFSNLATRRERDAKTTALARAQAVSGLLQQLLASSNPEEVKGAQYTVRELLDEFSSGLGDQLAGDAEVESAIRAIIGNSYRRLGVTDRADLHLKKALDLRRETFGESDERVAESLVDYGWSLAEQSRHPEAEALVREALAIYQQRQSDPRLVVRALASLNRFLISQGRLEEAEQVANEAIDLASQGEESQFPELPNVLHDFASAKSQRGQYAEAEKLSRRAVDIHRHVHGNHHPETAWGLQTLGVALRGQQKFDEAEHPLREALAIFREYYAPEHKSIQGVTGNLKLVLDAKGDRAALEALAKEEAEAATRAASPDLHVRLAELLLLASKSSDADREAEARRQIRRALEDYGQVAVKSPDALDSRLNAVEGYVKLAELCTSDPDFSQEFDDVHRHLTAELAALLASFPDSARAQEQVGHQYRFWATPVQHNRKYSTQVEQAYREAIKVYEKLTEANPKLPNVWYGLANSWGVLSDVHRRSGRTEEADAASRQALEIYQEHAAEIAKASTGDACQMVVDYFRLAGLVPTNLSQEDNPQAYRFIEQVIDEYRQITADYQDNLDNRVGALTGYARAAGTCAGAKCFEDEVDDLNRRLEAELPKLLAAFPNSGECQWQSAMLYREWAFQLAQYSRYLPQVEHALGESIELLKQISKSDPKRPRIWLFLADTYVWLADARRRLGRTEEASEASRQALGIFDQHKTEIEADGMTGDFFGITADYLYLADFLAVAGREKEAAELIAKAALAAERLKDPIYVSDALFGMAHGRLLLGDEAGYHSACAAQLALRADNGNDQIRLRRLWIWCLGPHPGDDLSAQVHEAEAFAKNNSLDLPYLDLLTLGALYFRAGKYDEAAKRLNDSIAAFPSEPPYGACDVVYPKLFLAMIHWQQGRRGDARQLLAETQPDIDKYYKSPLCPWFGRIQLEALRREAESLIEPKTPDEAPTKDNPTSITSLTPNR